MKELEKELKKNRFDDSKVTRLMSLTFAMRRSTMLSLRADVRIVTTLRKYPCLNKPIFVSVIC